MHIYTDVFDLFTFIERDILLFMILLYFHRKILARKPQMFMFILVTVMNRNIYNRVRLLHTQPKAQE